MKPYALIITADLNQAQRYKKMLDLLGYQVQFAATGARAQVQLAFTTPDLIALDMQLPDMPGEVLLRQIKAHSRLEKSTLIFLTLQAAEMIHEKIFV